MNLEKILDVKILEFLNLAKCKIQGVKILGILNLEPFKLQEFKMLEILNLETLELPCVIRGAPIALKIHSRRSP